MEKIYKLKHIIEDRIESLEDEELLLETNYVFGYGDTKDIQTYLDKCNAINFRLCKLNNYLKIVDNYINHCSIQEDDCIKLDYLLEYFKLKEK